MALDKQGAAQDLGFVNGSMNMLESIRASLRARLDGV